MEEKVKVALLGVNHEKISSVIDKVNATRPVEGTTFTDLKEFLSFCVKTKPQVVAISVGFPHRSVMQFPKVFKMAIGAQVIIFAEDQELKSQKRLGSIQADFKITGIITAHNLWMRIISCKKAIEQAEAEKSGSSDGSSIEKESQTVHLKGKKKESNTQESNSLLNSLLAGLGEPSSSQVSSVDSDSDLNPISSLYKPDHENQSSVLSSSASMDEEGSSKSLESSIIGTNDLSETNREKITAQQGLKSKDQKKSANTQNEKNKKKAQDQKKTDQNRKAFDGQLENEDQKKQPQHDENSNNKNTEKKEIELQQKKHKVKPSGDNGTLNKDKNNEAQSANARKTDSIKKQQKNNLENSKNKKGANTQGSENSEKEFGAVKLADEKGLRADKKEKQQVKKKQDFEKHKSILVQSCEKGLKEVFESNNLKGTESFSNKVLYAFVVEMSGISGYLLLATGHKLDVEQAQLKDFHRTIIDFVNNAGIGIELSKSYLIDIHVDNYPEVTQNFCEFIINSSNPSEQKVHIGFVQRESLWPKFEESDKENMYLVDIKVIPPHTKVNFDAYIYLPKNNKFVRYLKEGRSLSLEQAKRHTKTAENSKFYLPKDHQPKFIKFFIQNTIQWEFAVYSKKEVA